jgi:DNA-binding response OmpR family regulator
MHIIESEYISSMKTMRILVIDDYQDIGDSMCMLMAHMGHDCRFAVCAKEALDMIGNFIPELALVDVVLPDMTGNELATELRARLGPGCYIAAVTGKPTAANPCNYDECLLKPVDCGVLTRLINCARRRGAQMPG